MEEMERLLALQGRGEIKRAGEWLDKNPAQKSALVALAAKKGVELDQDAAELPGKKLLRLCMNREDGAQVRKNPIARDEAFPCVHCGRDVPPGGKRPRDHCPFCLHSLHVDDVPGDRASGCGGLLVPVAARPHQGVWMIEYRCRACGVQRRNRVLDDVQPPDDPALLRRLVASVS
jgi:RNHCP domain